MNLPTEPVGSVPRSPELQATVQLFAAGKIGKEQMDKAFDDAVEDTILRFEKTGSPIVSDGEQAKSSFATYLMDGLDNLAPDGVIIPFSDGHTRQLPRLTRGPFKYGLYAGSYLPRAGRFASKPLKQAVISASAMSLLYPEGGIPDYSQPQFIEDLIAEAVADIRSCFDNGAEVVQVDFTEGRLAVKLDPSKGLLKQFIDLNNRVFAAFTPEERQRIGVHTCPGGDHNSTHSADVDYRELIPMLMDLDVGNFYMQMASEKTPDEALSVVAGSIKANQRVFIGVIDVIDNTVESAQTVKERVMNAARHIPADQLGTTDDCGFSPFGDDLATARDTAFAKITARVEGTRLASEELGI
ncbi:cobalamin-independent methionine synthase II family protein [Granulosicoccus sp. 3-233]|uniref:cobalamin-independent methionine synthase II family protein n=1 Tax=Granulosicoccus sp. 3-233 TaxID=3417969 RepID=UPI003D35821E